MSSANALILLRCGVFAGCVRLPPGGAMGPSAGPCFLAPAPLAPLWCRSHARTLRGHSQAKACYSGDTTGTLKIKSRPKLTDLVSRS